MRCPVYSLKNSVEDDTLSKTKPLAFSLEVVKDAYARDSELDDIRSISENHQWWHMVLQVAISAGYSCNCSSMLKRHAAIVLAPSVSW